jgi:hypothetical protein
MNKKTKRPKPIVYISTSKEVLVRELGAKATRHGVEKPCVLCKTALLVQPEPWRCVNDLAKLHGTTVSLVCGECVTKGGNDLERVANAADDARINPENN